VIVAVLAAAVLVTACAAPGSAGRGSETSDSGGGTAAAASLGDVLSGRTFLSTAVTGHDLVKGSRISLEFRAPHSLHVRAGCNYLSGDYRLVDGRLMVDTLAMTEMGCDKSLMQQDDWLAGLLQDGLSLALDGNTLALSSGDVRIALLDREVADPDRPLVGTVWMVDGIIDGDTASSVPQDVRATMSITNCGIMYFDGRHDYAGPVAIDGDVVHPGRITGGGSGIGPQGNWVDMSVLTHDFHYRVEADRLTVTGAAGKGLTFFAFSSAADSSGAAIESATGMPPPPPTEQAGSCSKLMQTPPETVATGVPSTVAPASPAPVVTPGTLTVPTGKVTGKSLRGGHDSIPPQPSPAGGPGQEPAQSAPGNPGSDPTNPLVGHRFRLVGLSTDAGGADTKSPGATFDITFGPASAVAQSSCGTIRYPAVRYYPTDVSPTVDLGDPAGPACSLGSDPTGVPSGQLMYSVQDGKLFLSTGFVGWRFQQAG
jgi:heat shock protein HslJ